MRFLRFSFIFVFISLVVVLIVLANQGKGEVGAFDDDYLVISAVGDTMLGSTYPTVAVPKESERLYNLPIVRFLSNADIVFGNLEGPIVDGGVPTKRTSSGRAYAFRMPTYLADDLQKAGFNAMSIANNHSRDFGEVGIQSTIRELTKRGIQPVGGKYVAEFNIKGKKICILGFYTHPSEYAYSLLDVEEAKRIVKSYKEKYDIVIVSFHGGAEGPKAQRLVYGEERFFGENRGNVIKFARSVVDAGADLVLGHGPHVLRGVEVYKGKFIAYSLGNFYTYEFFSTSYPNNISAIMKIWISLKDGNFVKVSVLPLKQNERGVPQIDESKTAIKLLEKLSIEDLSYKPNFIVEDILALKN